MDNNVTRVIESPHGIGRLSISGHDLGECHYWLQVEQEFTVIHTYNSVKENPSQETTTGTLVFRQKLEVGEQLTLRLQDERQLDIRIEQANIDIGNYRIRATGEFR